MRQSPNVEIRELIIRCVSQMVLARVANIKSGWKSMFMVRVARVGLGLWLGLGLGLLGLGLGLPEGQLRLASASGTLTSADPQLKLVSRSGLPYQRGLRCAQCLLRSSSNLGAFLHVGKKKGFALTPTPNPSPNPNPNLS